MKDLTMSNRYISAALLGALLACAASAQAAEGLSGRQKVSPTIIPNFNQPDVSVANSAYTLSPEEQKLDCKKLTGRMQIRIQQLRAAQGTPTTSAVSRTLQAAATPFVGGTTRGIDPQGDNARDLSMLKAYNAQLAAKGCKTYDLEAQLAPGNKESPRPVPKPAAAGNQPAAKAP
jgi:hypothetical protein